MNKRWISRILIVIFIVAAILVLRATVLRPDPVPVTIFRVAPGLVEDTVTNSKAGTVETRKRASISPELGGLVSELLIREGQRVTAGQVMMRIADDALRARLTASARAAEAALAARDESCTYATQAERELARYIRLAQEEIVSQELLDQFQSRRDSAASACEGARARLLEAAAARELAEVDLKKTVIRAPFDGVVSEISCEIGEYITPAPPGVPIPPVIEILDDRAIYISAPLDEVDVARVTVSLPVRVSLDAYPAQSFGGTVVRIAPFVLDIEEQNRTFEIEVELLDTEFAASLPPGASADVEVILDSRQDVLRVPSYALIEGGRVLILDEGVLRSREVKSGLKNWAFTEITSGLQEGEMVVVSLDRAEVRDGAEAIIEAETMK